MAGNLTWAQVVAIPKHLAGKHPAEISGPSRDPTKQLMNLPPEVRYMIWRCVYVKASHIKLRCSWQPNQNRPRKDLSTKPKGIISMLCANKKALGEGLHILYGENHFEFYHVRVFGKRRFNNSRKHPYVNGIGMENAAMIKTATFEVPLSIIEESQDATTCGPSLHFLCTALVGLRKLTIKTQTFDSSWHIGEVAKLNQKQSIQAILTTAARVTKYHPALHKAVWRRWSGSEVKDGGLIADFYIDLFQEGCAPALGSMTTKDAYGEDVQSLDVVLDSAHIRRTPWLKPDLWDGVAAFKLPDTIDSSSFIADSNTNNTRSSEMDPGAIATWPGITAYDPLLELSYDDQVTLVRHRRGRFIKGDLVAGNLVGGKFVKGHWFGSNFVEGSWIGPRRVGGKPVPSQFTPGKWVGEQLVEGKMVNGVFVQGLWEMETFTQGKWVNGVFTMGRWDGERFIEGKWEGPSFFEGKWTNGRFTEGRWEGDRFIEKKGGRRRFVHDKWQDGARWLGPWRKS